MADVKSVVIPLAQVKAHLALVRKREKQLFGSSPSPVDEKVAVMHTRLDMAQLNEKGHRVQSAPTVEMAFDLVHEMAEDVANAAAGLSACKKGCSHCCNIPVSITSLEAALISERTGRKMVQPKAGRAYMPSELGDKSTMLEFQRVSQKRYFGVPCTFKTSKGDCSIYEHRPLPCRLQLNMDSDDLLCKLVPNSSPRVPYVDSRQIELMVLTRVMTDPPVAASTRIADIRDWFPRA